MPILFVDELVLQTDLFEVHQDWEVPIVGFFILTAKRKVRSVADFTPLEEREFGVVIARVRRGMKEALGIEDVYIFQNEDSQHGFHVWLFPRHDWMERFGRKIESVRPIMRYATEYMADEATCVVVREAVRKMRVYSMA